jgi:hypothetical protein
LAYLNLPSLTSKKKSFTMYTAYAINPIYGDEYYLIEGEDSYCEQLVRKSKKTICLMDKKEWEIYRFEFEKYFIDFLKTKKDRNEEHLIDFDFEDYVQFLFVIFEVDD